MPKVRCDGEPDDRRRSAPHPSRPRTTLDTVDRALLVRVSGDGWRPAAALAKDLGLSRRAVTQRLKALEDRGVIRATGPLVPGLFARAPGRRSTGSASAQKEKEVLRLLTENPLLRSVFRVSSEDRFVAEVVSRASRT